MHIYQFWLIFLFAVSFMAYLSFSVASRQATEIVTMPPERKKEDFKISPLSRLFPKMEDFLGILNFSRVIFVVPVLIIGYQWTSQFKPVSSVLLVLLKLLLLYILPEWVFPRYSTAFHKGAVQVISYLLYPIYWVLSRLMPAASFVDDSNEEQKKTNGEQHEEESEEFKGDILKAISVIGETTVREVMTPRVDMVCIPSTTNLEELHQAFKEHKFSRLPVYKEKVDHIIGIVSLMDLVSLMPNYDVLAPVTDLMRPATFVPETKKVFHVVA